MAPATPPVDAKKKLTNLRADAKVYEEELKKKITDKERDPEVGPAHPDTTGLLTRLGSLYVSMSKWREAVDTLERAIDIQRIHLKADHPQIPLTISLLADAYMKLEKYSDIEFRFNQYDRKAEADVGPDHPLVGEIKYNLGSFYRIRSRYPESRENYEKSLDIWQKKLRPDHPRLISAFMELSGVCRLLGMNEQAEALLKRTIKLRTKVLGEDHLKVGELLKELGLFYKNIGKLKEAESTLQRSSEILQKTLGRQSPLLTYVKDTIDDIQRILKAHADEQAAEAKAVGNAKQAKGGK